MERLETVFNIQQMADEMQTLPANQDVIIPDDVPLAAWRTGQLPDPQLEKIAIKLYRRRFPDVTLTDPVFRGELDDARGFAIQLAFDYGRYFQLTPARAAEQLADAFASLVFGDRRLGKTIREAIYSFAECTVSDLWISFGKRLTYHKDIEANHVEVEQERNQ